MLFEVGPTYSVANDTIVATYFCITLPSPACAVTHESIATSPVSPRVHLRPQLGLSQQDAGMLLGSLVRGIAA